MGRVAITGAAGFVGRHCVAEARRHNLHVVAIVRRLENLPGAWRDDAHITVFALDLADPCSLSGLSAALSGVQALIHCAATLSGDQARDTLQASQQVIDAAVAADVPHVVLAGSFDVYDVRRLGRRAKLSESCPIGTEGRTPYAKAKQAQEVLFEDSAALYGFALSTLRLGAVWGAGHLFNAHLGPAAGPALVVIDGGGTLPLCHVARAATLLVAACGHPDGLGTLNILDDDLPTRQRFVRAFRACGWPRVALRLPLWPWRLLATLTPDKDSTPGLLRRAILETRHRPLAYDTSKMHKTLTPQKNAPFESLMRAEIDRQNTQVGTG
jgi:UDP-glucose 4-epimerase